MANNIVRDSMAQADAYSHDATSFIKSLRKEKPVSLFDDDGEGDEIEITQGHQNTEEKPSCSSASLARMPKWKGKSGLFVFVSLGLPHTVLRDLSVQAKGVGGVLVLRGLVDNSFIKTQKKMMEIGVEVAIDPTLFDAFSVTRVPTFVLSGVHKDNMTGPFDKVSGNVSVRSALELFSMEGDLRENASLLYEKSGGNL